MFNGPVIYLIASMQRESVQVAAVGQCSWEVIGFLL